MVSLKLNALLAFFLFMGSLMGCAQKQNKSEQQSNKAGADSRLLTKNNTGMEIATFGNGCFWCTEAVFQQLEGVEKVESGYSGGHVDNPTYKQVCTGTTGHAEVLRITYDPKIIGFDELLEVFWATHDPTTLNRQGNDVGTQYRSVIFYHNDEQKQLSEKYKKELDASGAFDKPIVTAIEPIKNYYAAENYHQDYYLNNGEEPYCRYVVQPKVEKFRKVFKNKLKSEYSVKQ
jgi:peptide-methionine (S)-S-oxide reductase